MLFRLDYVSSITPLGEKVKPHKPLNFKGEFKSLFVANGQSLVFLQEKCRKSIDKYWLFWYSVRESQKIKKDFEIFLRMDGELIRP